MIRYILSTALVAAMLMIMSAALLGAYNAGHADGAQFGFKTGWAQGHEKRLMSDMEDICI